MAKLGLYGRLVGVEGIVRAQGNVVDGIDCEDEKFLSTIGRLWWLGWMAYLGWVDELMDGW